MPECRTSDKDMIISYMRLRQLIGVLGIVLPFVCIAGGVFIAGERVQESISIYYYTNMRDFFIGAMGGLSLFLFTYKGYCKVDDLVTTACAIMGLGLTVFPCMSAPGVELPVGIFMINESTSEIIHSTFAGLFFFLLAMNSIFLFTRSDLQKHEFLPEKKNRNSVYRACGIIIICSLALLGLIIWIKGKTYVRAHRIPLFFEIIMLISFSISWLIKGGVILNDVEHENP